MPDLKVVLTRKVTKGEITFRADLVEVPNVPKPCLLLTSAFGREERPSNTLCPSHIPKEAMGELFDELKAAGYDYMLPERTAIAKSMAAHLYGIGAPTTSSPYQ